MQREKSGAEMAVVVEGRLQALSRKEEAGAERKAAARRRLAALQEEEWTLQEHTREVRRRAEALVAAAIYACEGGDDFVREHKGLSFGVWRVCRPYYEDESVAEQGGLDLTSLAPRELMAAQGAGPPL